MLEISHARGSNGAPRSPPAGPQGQLGVPGALREAARGDQNDPLRPKNIVLQYKMLKITIKASG